MAANDPTNIDRARAELERLGIPAGALSDEQTVELWGRMLRDRIVAPAIPAGSTPVNARVWITAALTAGGFRQPEDRRQRADLGDGGGDVDLGVVAMVVMRHMGGSRPQGWTDEALAARVGDSPENFARAQRVLDESAEDVGRPASPSPRWWLAT